MSDATSTPRAGDTAERIAGNRDPSSDCGRRHFSDGTPITRNPGYDLDRLDVSHPGTTVITDADGFVEIVTSSPRQTFLYRFMRCDGAVLLIDRRRWTGRDWRDVTAEQTITTAVERELSRMGLSFAGAIGQSESPASGGDAGA